MARTHKRAFGRELGMVIDRYHEGTTPCELRMVESELLRRGARHRGQVSRGTDTGFLARVGQPRSLNVSHDRLLEGLGEDDAAAPLGLLWYLEVPGTRQALIEATERVPAARVATYAQALAMLGGVAAANVVHARRTELLGRLSIAGAIPSEQVGLAVGLLSCVVAGLVLDGADTEAATNLIAMMDSPEAWLRGLALVRATELATRLCTKAAAIEMVRRAIEERASTSDLDTFVRVAPYLMALDQEATLGRCEAALATADYGRRAELYNVLRHTNPPSIGIARLLTLLRKEEEVRLALGLMSYLHPLVDEALAQGMLERALGNESPSLRFAAIGVCNTVSDTARRDLLRSALQDEPDPLIAQTLQAELSRDSAS